MHKEKKIEETLLNIVKEFIAEFKSDLALHTLSLQSELEALGIDSLGRVELFLRIERTFAVSLPDDLMATAKNLQDIAKALETAKPATHERKGEFVSGLEASRLDPSHATNLLEVLLRHAALEPNRPHIYLQDDKGEEEIITYGALLEEARKVAGGLLALGLQRHETVAIMLPTSRQFFEAFMGIMLAGGIPVPIYPPIRADKIEEYALRAATILNSAEARILITFSQVETLSKLLRVFVKSMKAVTLVDTLKTSKERLSNLKIANDEAAMIQYTSGSTSDPKGVLLSHHNLLSNIRATGKAVNLQPNDVGISWLPLYHDMGLIGAWFSSLYFGFPVTIMSPLTFLARPERWLWAIHYHRGTLSAGPNFAYELCVRKIDDRDIEGLDLSAWRLAFNGAEEVKPKTLERFIKRFEPYGFKAESFYPVYGLAESSVALAFPPLYRGPKIDVIARVPFEKEGRAIPCLPTESPCLEFVCCGKAIPDHEIRIVDEEGRELGERQVGSLHFSGPSSMQGYYRNPEATRAIYHEGWLDSGDLAYMAEGEIYITGRKKDIIVKAGRNIYPQEIEEVAAQVSGIRKGCVIAFGVLDPRWGTEKLVIVAETIAERSKDRDEIALEVNEKVSVVLGIPPDEILLVAPKTIPKTSSGKLQRSACKRMYLEGSLKRSGMPAWLQMTKLYLISVLLSIQKYVGKILQLLYTGYVALLVLIFLPITWLGIRFSSVEFSYHFLRSMAKAFILCTFCPTYVSGTKNFSKDKSYVFVSNHASYMDAVLLVSTLPAGVLFVGKQELLSWPLVGSAIKKLGYLTVDRVYLTKSLEAAEHIEDALRQNKSVLIFPEGTFTYATGLRPFKTGAFKMAVDTGAALCPVALQGTRRFLRGGTMLLHPVRFDVWIGQPEIPLSKDWSEVTRLHTLARKEIAEHCGELTIDMIAGAGLKKNNE